MPYIGKKPADIIATAVDTTTGTFSGDLTVDTSTLYVDSANNRVGVGTVSPSYILDIQGQNAGTDAILRVKTLGTQTYSDAFLFLETAGSGISGIHFGDSADSNAGLINYDHSDNSLYIRTNATEAMRIDSNGNLGIGTASPRNASGFAGLTLDDASGGFVDFNDSGTRVFTISGNATGNDVNTVTAIPMRFKINNTERMRIDSSGKVGIGTSSPLYELDVGSGSGSNSINIFSGSTDTSAIYFTDSTSGIGSYIGRLGYNHTADAMLFTTNASERMRIDSSGRLLVGKTSTNFGVEGVELGGADGKIFITRDNNSLYLNRLSSDGNIVQFYKDSSAVGSIGSVASGANLYISANSGVGMGIGNDNLYPVNAAGASTDGSLDIGDASARFRNLYLSGGVYLGGTGSANLLDDYEEGTHQITVTMSGSGTVTLNTSFDRFSYTKVGRLVTITGNPRIASVSSPVGNLLLTVPFTAVAGQTDECRAGGIIRYYDNSAGAGSYSKPIAWSIGEGTSTLQIDNTNTNGNNLTPAASDEFYFSISYMTN